MFDVTPACADVAIMNRETADIAVIPKRKKVAIVGFATNTLHLVPWNDPQFEIWGLNQGYLHMLRRADRWFEMHLKEATADVRDPAYLTWLAQCQIPIYMIQCDDEIPSSVRFPIEDALHLAGRDYFMSSISYMIALAILEKFEEIHLYGINLAIGDEWAYERPNAEWWLGIAKGMGIKTHVPSASSLLKQHARYGYTIDARPHQSLKQLVQARIAEYTQRAEQLSADLHVVIGAKKEDEALIQILEGVDHGADIVLVPQPTLTPAPTTS